MENMTLEVHITDKVSFPPPPTHKSGKDLSVWFSSLPSARGPTSPHSEQTVEDQRHDRKEAKVVGCEEPGDEGLNTQSSMLKKMKSRCHSNSEMSVLSEHSVGSINGDSGVSGIFAKSFDLHTPVSSRGEPSTLQSLDGTETGIDKDQLTPASDVCVYTENPTAGEDSQTNAVPGISQEIPAEEDSNKCDDGGGCKLVADLEIEKRSKTPGHLEGSDVGPAVAAEAVVVGGNKSGSALGKSALMVEEVEMSYHSCLSELAPYKPVVEIYTQLGAQVRILQLIFIIKPLLKFSLFYFIYSVSYFCEP